MQLHASKEYRLTVFKHTFYSYFSFLTVIFTFIVPLLVLLLLVLLVFLGMTTPGYLSRGKHLFQLKHQNKAPPHRPPFLRFKTKTASRTNCSPHPSKKKTKQACGASWKREGMLFLRRPAWITSPEDFASKVSLCKMMNVVDASE